MHTELVLELHHRFSPKNVVLRKTFDGIILPPFRHQEMNFSIQIEHEEGAIDTEVQSVVWLPEENLISIRTPYVYYDSIKEMYEKENILRGKGWS